MEDIDNYDISDSYGPSGAAAIFVPVFATLVITLFLIY